MLRGRAWTRRSGVCSWEFRLIGASARTISPAGAFKQASNVHAQPSTQSIREHIHIAACTRAVNSCRCPLNGFGATHEPPMNAQPAENTSLNPSLDPSFEGPQGIGSHDLYGPRGRWCSSYLSLEAMSAPCSVNTLEPERPHWTHCAVEPIRPEQFVRPMVQ